LAIIGVFVFAAVCLALLAYFVRGASNRPRTAFPVAVGASGQP